ncbi:MAG: hypothetical protein V5A30_02875 [Haloarculaceae archaeon]
MQLTRRQLLAGVGAGALGVTGASLTRDQPRYTHYTYASDGDLDDRRVRVAWYERYNGVGLESQAGATEATLEEALDPDTEPAYVDDPTDATAVDGPVVTVGNVLPGDEGTLVVGLEAVDGGDFIPEPLDVWLRGAVTADGEGGLNEAETAAGDRSSDGGELDEWVTVELWRDGSPLGSCNGRRELDEQLEAPLVERAPVRTAFGPDTDIGDADGQRVLSGLSPGASRCFALAWAMPSGEGVDVAQSDSVAFELTFGVAPAGAASPFTVEPDATGETDGAEVGA